MILQNARISIWRGAARLGLVMVAVVVFIRVQPARAETEQPCSYGGAQALLQEAPVAATQAAGSDQPKLGQLWERCQFRLYQDGETVTFREVDYILGAIAVWVTYEELDEFELSRAEAIEFLQMITDRLEVSSVTGGIAGPFEPVPVIVTKYRDVQLFGEHIVFNQRAFITQLPVGEYLVRWTQSFPGEPDFVSTVRLLVTPA